MIILQLTAIGLVSVLLSGILYFLRTKGCFEKLSYWQYQVMIGLIFGLAAVAATEFGVAIDGATINARDAAPLCAGLIFGGPAGIISGIIGGVYRWIAVSWGAGAYSQIACSVSTCLAGFYAAGLRKWVFEGRTPRAIMGLITGVIIEVFHLTLVFVTHLNDSTKAIEIVKICTLPMVCVNALSVAAAVVLIAWIGQHNIRPTQNRELAYIVQKTLTIAIVFGYLLTTGFVYLFQTNISSAQIEQLMEVNINDVKNQVNEALDAQQIRNLSEEAYEAYVYTMAQNLTRYRHVSQTGYILIVDGEDQIISDVEGHENKASTLAGTGLELVRGDLPEGVFRGTVYDEECLCLCELTGGNFLVVAVVPVADAFVMRDIMIYVYSFMEVMIFAVMFFVLYYLLKRLVVDNIRKVNGCLAKIISGDLETTVDVRSSREFASLSDDINATVDALNHFIKEAETRIDKELSFARSIQYASLPSVFPPWPDEPAFDLYARMEPAKQVGGDFYDFYRVGEDQLYFLIADVSGKGIPAAMFMMKAKTLFKSLLEAGLSLTETVSEANAMLCEENDEILFVTMWIGQLNRKTGEVQYINAGHNAPILVPKDGTPEYLKVRPNFVLAGMESVRYRLHTLQLHPGDRLFLYTDGITEAQNLDNTLYGEERLLATISQLEDKLSLSDTLQTIRRSVDGFVGEAEQFDDMTMLLLEYRGQ